jgi:hypothetical protein
VLAEALLRIAAKQPGAQRASRPRIRVSWALPWAALPAAALLLGALVLILFRGHGPVESPATAGQASEDALVRLIEELKSPSPVHRELALCALKAYGGAAIGPMKKATVAPELIDACRGITPGMRAIEKKLESTKISLSFRDAPAQQLLGSLRELTGIRFVVNAASSSLLHSTLSLEARDESIGAALGRILAPLGLRLVVSPDLVVFVTDQDRPEVPPRMPLRIPGAKALSEQDLLPLANGSPEARQLAERRVRAQGFAVESALWKALDGNSADLRLRAAELLRSLYRIAEPASLAGPRSPLPQKVQEFRITIDLQDSTLSALLDYMASVSGLNIVIDPVSIPNPEQEMISFTVSNIVLDGALRLMLQPRQKTYAVVEDVVIVTAEDRIRFLPKPPFWGSPADVLQMEKLLGDLISGDRGRSEQASGRLVELGMASLGPLWEAEAILPAEDAQRCRQARLQVEQTLGGWFPDEPSGADLETLNAAQRGLLARRVSVGKGSLLKDALEKLQVKGRWKAGDRLALSLGVKDVPLGSLLRAVLGPAGLDFSLDGETLIVDEAAKIRAALQGSPR